ncbi:anther-specific protein LAT52-like [Primulina eburnea]|uniref:anther-specific protein LAT52-like n=1 Tax=Primulina eburnea TaxID=1245227 RepID=UPI003C6C0392
MAKAVALISAFCIIAFAAVTAHAHAHSQEVFNVEGDVYCDPCRLQFQTKLSTKLPGATVRLVCTDAVTKAVTYSVEGVANADGHYSLSVVGDHEKEICEVMPVASPRSDCAELMNDIASSRIVCTRNSGIHEAVRFANPLGFMTKDIFPECLNVIKDLELFVEA